MPHYKDGTPAQIGDFVKGKPYNTDHEVVGEIVQIAPGSESCNCIVAFSEVAPLECDVALALKLQGNVPGFNARAKGGIADGSGQSEFYLLVPKTDYGEVRAFEKV